MSEMRIASLLSRASNSYQLALHSLNDCPHIFQFYYKQGSNAHNIRTLFN